MSNHKRWLKQIGVFLILTLPSMVMGLPPKIVQSAREVNLVATPIGSRSYQVIAGPYGYRFLWDSGPVEIILHAIHGYDLDGNKVVSLPAGVLYYDIYFERLVDMPSEPELLLKFIGNGTARYAETLPLFRIPEQFYSDSMIQHVSAEFSVVDGRMSIGPWLSMLTDWGDESSVLNNIEILLW
ncbi:hypothetical protein GCM10023116_24790 [Kistimonas scapharcae]|uniref:Uncharacterized protein n=1 Tax=Kistimonas scapharcae TaxID=1036133 RepID=A0ABP8V4J9_9GAMM